MRRVYALLIGIDSYPPPIPPLYGCVNDIHAITAYLHRQYAARAFQLHSVSLLNQDATRQAIIDGFHNHLRLAGPDDTAFVYFSGHGSQQQAPPELWHLESDRLNETLVCWDSRTPSSWDLADKELASLIADVAAGGAHVLVILDCCHSGTGTRMDTTSRSVRAIPPDERARPLSTLIRSITGVTGPSRTVMAAPDAWVQVPHGRHVLLAACADRQLACEYTTDGLQRGAFSYFLLATLHEAGPGATYRDLFKQAAARLLHARLPQTPQIEATYPKDLDLPFLETASIPRLPMFTVSYHHTSGWVVDGGALHGLPVLNLGKQLTLALYPFDALSHPLAGEAPYRRVAVSRVRASYSLLDPASMSGVDHDKTFRAIMVAQDQTPLAVHFAGDEAALDHVRALQGIVGISMHITKSDDAQIHVVAEEEGYTIRDHSTLHPLVQIGRYTQASAAAVLGCLWRIARWHAIVQLTNPMPRHLHAGSIVMELYEVLHAASMRTPTQYLWSSAASEEADHVRLRYTSINGSWHPPICEARLSNASSEPLYCALLALSEDFSMVNLLAGACVRLDPGESIWTRARCEVPDDRWVAGIREIISPLKLIVCHDAFDATLFEQDLHAVQQPEPARTPPASRKFTPLADRRETRDDWLATTVVITVTRPAEAHPHSL